MCDVPLRATSLEDLETSLFEMHATILLGPRAVLSSLSTAITCPCWNYSLTTHSDAPKQAMGPELVA